MQQKALRIIPLGGLGEVGKNMMVYEYDESILIVDTGLMFPDSDMLGVDYIIPDFNYLMDKRDRVAGIVITHGHEDHIGAIQHVLAEVNAPIYATPLTRGLIEVKLARNGLASKAAIHTVQADDTVQIGPFQVEFFHVCHSIPDAVGLGIVTPVGLVVHTGDYKFDQTPVDNWPTDFAKLAEFSDRGVLALLADSTNAERAGWTPSERVVDSAIDNVFTTAPGRIIIASFASLISRMQQVINAAQRHGRKLAFVGSSMVDNAKMARKLGYLEVPDSLIVSIEQAVTMPDDEVAILCTGSQGEPTSILGRLSVGRYRLFDVKSGDTIVLSSHPIPGNEEKVYKTINRLFQRGANVVYESIAPVHVSGHASQEEMKLLINLVRPKYVVPIHGELRHLRQHALLAEQVGVPREHIFIVENGQVIELKDRELHLAERVPGAYVFVDSSGVSDLGPAIIREREALSQDGVLIVHLVLEAETNRLLRDPYIESRGFSIGREPGEFYAQTRRKVEDALSQANGNLQKDVEQAVRSYLYNEMRRSPYVLVTVSRV